MRLILKGLGDPEIRVDRALIRLTLGQYWEAIDDLNRAQEAAPDSSEISAVTPALCNRSRVRAG